jgi:uncharacterized protein (TIGR03032 family)
MKNKQNADAQTPNVSMTFTRLFNACLRAENISLAIAGASPAGLALAGLQKDGKALFQSLGHPGMTAVATAADGTLWSAEKNFLWRWENGERTGGFRANDLRLYLPRLRIFTSDLVVSDLAVDGFGSLLVTSQAYSVVGRATPEASLELVWKPAFVSKVSRENRCGLSGLGLYDTERHCASFWGESDATDGWRGNFREGGRIITLHDGSVLCEGLCLPAKPRWSPEGLFVLNMGTAEVGKVNTESRAFEPICQCPGYPTGLAIHGPWAIVSVSATPPTSVADLDLPAKEAFRKRKVKPFSGVALIDLRTGDIAHHATFENTEVAVTSVAVITGCPGAMAFGPEVEKLDPLFTIKRAASAPPNGGGQDR